jgi:hypothetical protein
MVTSTLARPADLGHSGILGKKVGVVGWWTTWPAQPRTAPDHRLRAVRLADWGGRATRRTYPASLDSLVAALRRTPESVSWAELFQFVPAIDTTKVTERQKSLVQQLRWIYAADMTFYRVAMHLYRASHPDFFTVYFRGVDEVSHVYWDIDLPNNPQFVSSDAEYDWLKRIVPNYYVFTDRLIGDFLREAGPKTNVIVCSDHGFQGGGKGVGAHKVDGIVLMMGPDVKRDANISGATVLDITPTVLALFGLPTALDMDGRPIEDALTPSTLKRVGHEKRLATYETARPKGGEELSAPIDEGCAEPAHSATFSDFRVAGIARPTRGRSLERQIVVGAAATRRRHRLVGRTTPHGESAAGSRFGPRRRDPASASTRR